MIGGPFRYFVILAEMRTGSNLLENTISRYDDIACFGELFNPEFIGAPKKPSLDDIYIDARDADPIAVIKHIIEQNPVKITGFRLFPGHSKQVLDYVLSDTSCAKIILRRNPLDSFVSHQIAIATDQWQLRDLSVRRDTKIEFDGDKFQTYLETKRANDEMVNLSLQYSGQAAFQIKYEDMSQIETFNGAVKYLGIDQRLDDHVTSTKRQNPAGLRDKVTNYDEMRAALMELNHFESDTDPYLEPSKTSGSVAIHAGRTVPIMYFPVTHDQNDPILDWMCKVELDDLPPQTKMKGREVRDWLSIHNDRVVFTSLENPIERAYRAFNNRIAFINPTKNKWIRRVLIAQYGLDLPEWPADKTPRLTDVKNANYTQSQHRKNFAKFLKFVHGNLRGQTRAPIDPHWGSQHIKIAGYARWTVPNVVIHPKHRSATIKQIQDQLNIQPKQDIQPVMQTDFIPLADIYDPQIESATRLAYAEDYLKFGFQDWKPID